MLSYFVEWGHAYIIHFGAWITFAFAATVYKKGLPKPEELYNLFESAIILSAIISIFSSHSHAHYLSHFITK